MFPYWIAFRLGERVPAEQGSPLLTVGFLLALVLLCMHILLYGSALYWYPSILDKHSRVMASTFGVCGAIAIALDFLLVACLLASAKDRRFIPEKNNLLYCGIGMIVGLSGVVWVVTYYRILELLPCGAGFVGALCQDPTSSSLSNPDTVVCTSDSVFESFTQTNCNGSTCGGNANGAACKLPFSWNGLTFYDCTGEADGVAASPEGAFRRKLDVSQINLIPEASPSSMQLTSGVDFRRRLTVPASHISEFVPAQPTLWCLTDDFGHWGYCTCDCMKPSNQCWVQRVNTLWSESWVTAYEALPGLACSNWEVQGDYECDLIPFSYLLALILLDVFLGSYLPLAEFLWQWGDARNFVWSRRGVKVVECIPGVLHVGLTSIALCLVDLSPFVFGLVLGLTALFGVPMIVPSVDTRNFSTLASLLLLHCCPLLLVNILDLIFAHKNVLVSLSASLSGLIRFLVLFRQSAILLSRLSFQKWTLENFRALRFESFDRSPPRQHLPFEKFFYPAACPPPSKWSSPRLKIEGKMIKKGRYQGPHWGGEEEGRNFPTFERIQPGPMRKERPAGYPYREIEGRTPDFGNNMGRRLSPDSPRSSVVNQRFRMKEELPWPGHYQSSLPSAHELQQELFRANLDIPPSSRQSKKRLKAHSSERPTTHHASNVRMRPSSEQDRTRPASEGRALRGILKKSEQDQRYRLTNELLRPFEDAGAGQSRSRPTSHLSRRSEVSKFSNFSMVSSPSAPSPVNSVLGRRRYSQSEERVERRGRNGDRYKVNDRRDEEEEEEEEARRKADYARDQIEMLYSRPPSEKSIKRKKKKKTRKQPSWVELDRRTEKPGFFKRIWYKFLGIQPKEDKYEKFREKLDLQVKGGGRDEVEELEGNEQYFDEVEDWTEVEEEEERRRRWYLKEEERERQRFELDRHEEKMRKMRKRDNLDENIELYNPYRRPFERSSIKSNLGVLERENEVPLSRKSIEARGLYGAFKDFEDFNTRPLQRGQSKSYKNSELSQLCLEELILDMGKGNPADERPPLPSNHRAARGMKGEERSQVGSRSSTARNRVRFFDELLKEEEVEKADPPPPRKLPPDHWTVLLKAGYETSNLAKQEKDAVLKRDLLDLSDRIVKLTAGRRARDLHEHAYRDVLEDLGVRSSFHEEPSEDRGKRKGKGKGRGKGEVGERVSDAERYHRIYNLPSLKGQPLATKHHQVQRPKSSTSAQSKIESEGKKSIYSRLSPGAMKYPQYTGVSSPPSRRGKGEALQRGKRGETPSPGSRPRSMRSSGSRRSSPSPQLVYPGGRRTPSRQVDVEGFKGERYFRSQKREAFAEKNSNDDANHLRKDNRYINLERERPFSPESHPSLYYRNFDSPVNRIWNDTLAKMEIRRQREEMARGYREDAQRQKEVLGGWKTDASGRRVQGRWSGEKERGGKGVPPPTPEGVYSRRESREEVKKSSKKLQVKSKDKSVKRGKKKNQEIDESIELHLSPGFRRSVEGGDEPLSGISSLGYTKSGDEFWRRREGGGGRGVLEDEDDWEEMAQGKSSPRLLSEKKVKIKESKKEKRKGGPLATTTTKIMRSLSNDLRKSLTSLKTAFKSDKRSPRGMSAEPAARLAKEIRGGVIYSRPATGGGDSQRSPYSRHNPSSSFRHFSPLNSGRSGSRVNLSHLSRRPREEEEEEEPSFPRAPGVSPSSPSYSHGSPRSPHSKNLSSRAYQESMRLAQEAAKDKERRKKEMIKNAKRFWSAGGPTQMTKIRNYGDDYGKRQGRGKDFYI